MTSHRDQSLDAFRGLTVLLMILVNLQGNGDAAFAEMKHADWHGLTLADVIFPWFLFIVGLSVPLALDRAQSGSPWPAVFRRTMMLFTLGVLLAWLIRPVEFGQIRWMGVLQRIGIVYLACAIIVLMTRGWAIAALLALVALAAHSVLLFMPVAGLDSLTPGNGLNGWLDREFLPGRLLRKTWDPEGIFSTLPAIVSGLLGVVVTRLRRAAGDRKIWLIKIGLLASGLALSFLIPVNKPLWTASFVLLTAGLGLTAWRMIQAGWDHIKTGWLARLCVLFGQTALTFYVLHMLLLAVIVRKFPDGTRIWDWLYTILAATGLSPPLASLLFAIVAGALCAAPLPWLKRNGWLIKA